jgi:effector-binding domain-containing protein
MKLLRNLVILVVALAGVVFAGGFFLLPGEVSKDKAFTIDRPAASVYASLASAPGAYDLGNGITTTVTRSEAPGTVEAEVLFGGKKSVVKYDIKGQGASTTVTARLVQSMGANPLSRFQGMSGAQLDPVIGALETTAKADAAKLPPTDFSGLAYSVEQVAPRDFLYIEASTPTQAGGIKEGIRQAMRIVRQALSSNNLTPAGPPIAVETSWAEGQAYGFQAGLPYSGAAPSLLIGVKNGKTPAGTAIKVVYAGKEEDVIPTYDKVEALIAAARLKRSGPSFEVFLDDPDKDTGSQVREIYHIVEGDAAALGRIAPSAPAQAITLPAPTPEPAAAPAAPAAPPAPDATAAPAPAATPEKK